MVSFFALIIPNIDIRKTYSFITNWEINSCPSMYIYLYIYIYGTTITRLRDWDPHLHIEIPVVQEPLAHCKSYQVELQSTDHQCSHSTQARVSTSCLDWHFSGLTCLNNYWHWHCRMLNCFQMEQLERLRSEDTSMPPHVYLYYWLILDPKLKQDKVKITNLKNLPKLQFFLNL